MVVCAQIHTETCRGMLPVPHIHIDITCACCRHICAQTDLLHTYTYRCMFTNFCVDSLHRDTDTGSYNTWCLRIHTGMHSHAHTGRDVFQGERTMAQGACVLTGMFSGEGRDLGRILRR